MNKEEIRHFKAMFRQGSLRHMNIILDDKFQCELLNIIKDYEKQQQQNKKYKEVIDSVSTRLEYFLIGNSKYQSSQEEFIKLLNFLKEV